MSNNKLENKTFLFNLAMAVGFYICSVMYFTSNNNSMAVIFVALGSVLLCRGAVEFKKLKKE